MTNQQTAGVEACAVTYEHRAHFHWARGAKFYCRGLKNLPARSEVVTPYPEPDGTKTSGWSGSDTSQERAKTEDTDGTTHRRQKETLRLVSQHKHHGMTVKELRDVTGYHHGQASSALSVLHKEGLISRLVERREKCHVYVLAGWEEDREVQPHGRHRAKISPELSEAVRRAEHAMSVPSLAAQVEALRHALDLALKELFR